MERVALRAKYTGILHNQLHTSVKPQHHRLRPVPHRGIIRRRARVVKRGSRVGGEIRRVNAVRLAGEMGLQHGRFCWEGKRDIVDGSREFRPIGSLACRVVRARGWPEPDSEEEMLVHCLGDVCWEFGIGQTPKFSGEVGDEQCGVEEWECWFVQGKGFDVGWRVVLVLEYRGDGGIVESANAGEIRAG